MATREELRTILSDDLSLSDLHFVINNKLTDNIDMLNFFDLLFDQEDNIAYRSAWLMTHIGSDKRKFFEDKAEILITVLLKSKHCGKRRLILSIIHKNRLGIKPNLRKASQLFIRANDFTN